MCTEGMITMADKKFLIIDTKILPEIYERVIETKELLKRGKAKDITEATQMTGISRSTFYKYKDYIFAPSEGIIEQKATITLLLEHIPGVLSNLLNKISSWNLNILTINQDIPINNIANVNITFDMSESVADIDHIVESLKELSGVLRVELIAIE
jgi:chorismate mutase